MFYFDSSFRPVPLEQHFIGVRGKLGSPQFRRNLERVTFEKVADLVKEGHQVMVFVHSRKDTVHTAQGLKEAALAEGCLEDFSCEEHPTYSFFRSELARSRNKEMKELFEYGFGIHHAGMLREDRTRMERLFEARVIKVWSNAALGVVWLNDICRFSAVQPPSHGGSTYLHTLVCWVLVSSSTMQIDPTQVIIKGTQVYDSSRGAFTDLSILDVLQVFGRAGRPGMESSGIGFICTSDDKHHYYLDAVTSQVSGFCMRCGAYTKDALFLRFQ